MCKENESNITNPVSVPIGRKPHKPAKLLIDAGLACSVSEAKRIIKLGVVKVNGQKLDDFQKDITIDEQSILQVGQKQVTLNPNQDAV